MSKISFAAWSSIQYVYIFKKKRVDSPLTEIILGSCEDADCSGACNVFVFNLLKDLLSFWNKLWTQNWWNTMTRKFLVTVMSVFISLPPTLPTKSKPVSKILKLMMASQYYRRWLFSDSTWHVRFVWGNLCDGLSSPTIGVLLECQTSKITQLQ